MHLNKLPNNIVDLFKKEGTHEHFFILVAVYDFVTFRGCFCDSKIEVNVKINR